MPRKSTLLHATAGFATRFRDARRARRRLRSDDEARSRCPSEPCWRRRPARGQRGASQKGGALRPDFKPQMYTFAPLFVGSDNGSAGRACLDPMLSSSPWRTQNDVAHAVPMLEGLSAVILRLPRPRSRVPIRRGCARMLVWRLLEENSAMAVRIGVFVVSVLAVAWSLGGTARADSSVPVAPELPPALSLDDALHIFRTRGLELLIAEANVRSAEGAIKVAGAVPNPVVGASLGYAFTYTSHDPSCEYRGPSANPTNYVSCSDTVWNVGLSDSAALEDTLSGKRDLRLKVARNALASAKMSRTDAERTIAFQVEAAYLGVAQAVLGYKFAKDIAASNTTLLDKFKVRYASGAINDGDLARIETQKSEADQAMDSAVRRRFGRRASRLPTFSACEARCRLRCGHEGARLFRPRTAERCHRGRSSSARLRTPAGFRSRQGIRWRPPRPSSRS